jgi:hypothetical protein
MAFGTWFAYIAITPIYLVCKIGLEAKWYGIKISIANFIGRLAQGGLRCFLCPNKIWNSPLGTSNTLTIIENELEMRKLWPPKLKGVNNSKKQTIEHYKGCFLNTQKVPCVLFYCY